MAFIKHGDGKIVDVFEIQGEEDLAAKKKKLADSSQKNDQQSTSENKK